MLVLELGIESKNIFKVTYFKVFIFSISINVHILDNDAISVEILMFRQQFGSFKIDLF